MSFFTGVSASAFRWAWFGSWLFIRVGAAFAVANTVQKIILHSDADLPGEWTIVLLLSCWGSWIICEAWLVSYCRAELLGDIKEARSGITPTHHNLTSEG